MALGSSNWKCKDCGREHETDRKQCVNCGYAVLTPVDGEQRVERWTAFLALLPALLALVTMAALAWVILL